MGGSIRRHEVLVGAFSPRAFVSQVARFTVGHFGIKSPVDIQSQHVDFVYKILWATDELKFAIEMNITGEEVQKYLEDAALAA